jgi:hypothetical protein
MLARIIRFCLEQKLVVSLLVILIVGWGVSVAPFDWRLDWLPRNPVPVDAIPNLGENQQIVYHAMARPFSAGHGRPGHLSADRLAAGRSGRARGAQHVDVWGFIR